MKNGKIYSGEFSSRGKTLLFIRVDKDAAEKTMEEYLNERELDGLYNASLNSDGSVSLSLEYEYIEKVTIEK